MTIYRNYNRDGEFIHDEYMKHLSAMTTERLHSKSDIAYELAYRDTLISDVMEYCKRKCVNAIKSGHRCDSPLTGTEQAIQSILRVK